jgi:addiction module RelE/StbE family toxin
MEIVYSADFVKSVRLLPKSVRKKLADLLGILERYPFHPRLHTKPLAGPLSGFYSFRITRDWRVIFKFINSSKIFLIDAAHRSDIYK